MGAIGGLVGLSGGAAGTGFNGPGFANVQNPVSIDQANTAYNGVQNSLQSQQQLLSALQAQNGLQNQSQVYGQLQGVVNGTGPNPAQAMLNQSTGQNVANQAALMAGQRGASSNPALIARLAAQQGANLQQQAVGQGASLQAQQSLGALSAAGNLATTQAGQQIGQTNANTSAQQAEQANLLNAINGQNNSNVAMQGNVNNANASLANTTMQGTQNIIGGLMNGGGAASSMLMAAKGGMIPAMAAGGTVAGPQSNVGQFLAGVSSPAPMQTPEMSPGAPPNATAAAFKQKPNAPSSPAPAMAVPNTAQGAGSMGTISAAPFAKGGSVPVLLSPGEVYLSPQAVEMVRRGADPMHVGEKIGGEAPVKGAKNSYANDIVPKKAEAGGIVVPRSETMSENPDKNSKEFVDKTLAKRKKKV